MKALNSKKMILIAAIGVVMISAFFAFNKPSKPVPAGTGDVKAAAINTYSVSEQPSDTTVTKPSSPVDSGSEKSSNVSPPDTVKPPEKAPVAPTVASTAQDVFNGYFIDQDCFIAYEHPWEDNKDCLQMESCAASGYGIAVVQKDSSTFFYFDGTFAPNATNGQIQADKLIKNTSTIDHIYIEIKGKLTGDKKVAANGVSYGIIKVSSMKEVPAPPKGQ